jgi:acetyltransferase-like isoleucine patch superfamily enzyme
MDGSQMNILYKLFDPKVHDRILERLTTYWFSRYYTWKYKNLELEPGVRIGGRLKVSGSVKVRIGHGTRIRKNNHFFGEGTLTIGNNCLLNGCSIGCYTQIDIGDLCLIGDCYIVDNDFHNLQPELRHTPLSPKGMRPISIGKNVWIGSGARILKGVTIGENSVVGLGSIVRRAVLENVVVIGNPEQIIKRFSLADREHAVEHFHL